MRALNASPDQLAPMEVWLEDEYINATVALSELKNSDVDSIVPQYEQVFDALTVEQLDWLEERRLGGAVDELVFAPSVQEMGLKGLISGYDQARKRLGNKAGTVGIGMRGKDESSIWEAGWQTQFEDKAAIHDGGLTGPLQVGFLLGDASDPLNKAEPVNTRGELGLVHAGLGPLRQAELLDIEIDQESKSGRHLHSANIGQIVAADIKRIILKQPLLDSNRTITRMPHYGRARVGKGLYVLDVTSLGKELRLGGLNIAEEQKIAGILKSDGVRRFMSLAVSIEQ